MPTEPIISVSGLRGVIGQSLTPVVALQYSAALAAELPAGRIVLTRDGRSSGEMLAEAIRATLVALGRTVVNAGIAATPTTGILVRQLGAAGGIQISASHNPIQYNGMKLFGADGRVIPEEVGRRILQGYHQNKPRWAEHAELGAVEPCGDTISEHLRVVLGTVDREAIRRCGFRVLLDSNHGAGSVLGIRLLEELGCHVVAVGQTPNGRFAHPPEPIAENLMAIGELVRQAEASVGFCQDPDADRLAVIDAQGRYLGEEYTLALCLDRVLAERPGPIVTNCASSRMADDLSQRYGVPLYRSKVGEAHVADLMIRHDAVFGGEGNGGPIDPRVGYVRDSFVGMARILDAMAASGKSVAELAARLPRYAMHKTKVTIEPAAVPAALERLAQELDAPQQSRLDGLRLDWPDQWLLVRPSNTEPIVRVIGEAPDEAEVEALCRRAIALMQEASQER